MGDENVIIRTSCNTAKGQSHINNTRFNYRLTLFYERNISVTTKVVNLFRLIYNLCLIFY